MVGEATEISERLALVERSLRRYRAALAVVTVVAAAGLAGGPSFVGAAKAPEVVQAKKFEVVDDNGMVRASLHITGNDEAALTLNDKDGKARANLGTSGDAQGLTFFDKARKLRAALGTKGDSMALVLCDKDGKNRAGLAVTGDGAALALIDEAGRTRALLGTGGDAAGLTLNDKAEKMRASLITSGDLTTLNLADKAGNHRVALGNSDMTITETGSIEHRAVSSLMLLNEQGRVLWKAP